MMKKKQRAWQVELVLLLLWIALTAFFFANVEIQIEGPAGWAASLPTWRVENHWLLDIFWGGRPMTGYHAWVFSFMFLVFHLGVFINLNWSLRTEARIIASLMLFWVVEDFLWFIVNPSYGIQNFSRNKIPWHKHWFMQMPVDYWFFSMVSVLLIWASYAKWNDKSRQVEE
jgi:hypothetical protein